MKRKEKAERIQKMLEELYPEIPVPLDHETPFQLLVDFRALTMEGLLIIGVYHNICMRDCFLNMPFEHENKTHAPVTKHPLFLAASAQLGLA